ncbi:MAG: cupin domain-containing protein [Chloroflexi bacterium]|nr:cupin domain-containing protein [Chloroflexota bacterium]
MRLSGCIIKPDTLKSYSPEAHSGTTNKRLIGRESGARNLEVILGTVAPRGRADLHSHGEAEQVVYVLEGSIEVEMFGERQTARSGQAIFLPAGQPHGLSAPGDKPAKVLVIYAPPIQTLEQPFQRPR